MPRLGSPRRRLESGTLVVGQLAQVLDDLAQLGANLDLQRQAVECAVLELEAVDVDLVAPGAQRGEAAVASDRVQPRAQVDVRIAPAQRAVGRGEAVLERVLGLVAAAEHVPAEGEQAEVVAVVDRLERVVVAGPHPSDQALVAHRPQRPPARPAAGAKRNRGGGHGSNYAPTRPRCVSADVAIP
jgi:hypothetical protein